MAFSGLLSTLIHEPKAPGWGDSSPLQNPQNIKSDTDNIIGYIDFQSAIISRSLLNSFPFNNDLVYFLGGLDVDFNLCCETLGLLKVLTQELELIENSFFTLTSLLSITSSIYLTSSNNDPATSE